MIRLKEEVWIAENTFTNGASYHKSKAEAENHADVSAHLQAIGSTLSSKASLRLALRGKHHGKMERGLDVLIERGEKSLKLDDKYRMYYNIRRNRYVVYRATVNTI